MKKENSSKALPLKETEAERDYRLSREKEKYLKGKAIKHVQLKKLYVNGNMTKICNELGKLGFVSNGRLNRDDAYLYIDLNRVWSGILLKEFKNSSLELTDAKTIMKILKIKS